MLRTTCRDFADNELKPLAAKTDREHLYPAAQVKQMGDLGLMGITVPEEYGWCRILYISRFLRSKRIWFLHIVIGFRWHRS